MGIAEKSWKEKWAYPTTKRPLTANRNLGDWWQGGNIKINPTTKHHLGAWQRGWNNKGEHWKVKKEGNNGSGKETERVQKVYISHIHIYICVYMYIYIYVYVYWIIIYWETKDIEVQDQKIQKENRKTSLLRRFTAFRIEKIPIVC